MLAYTSEKIIRGIYSTRIIVDGDEEVKVTENVFGLVAEQLHTSFRNPTGNGYVLVAAVVLHERCRPT